VRFDANGQIATLVSCTALAAATDGALPTEFRIFAAGENDSTKGPALFDEAAAAAVMAEYQKQGVDLMIDLEHESIDETPVRADSKDARGWFKLEVRNGELWAVDVRWTPDGERRLRERTQRYISPVFLRTKKEKRVVYVLNVALCAMPATHNAPALVAASKRERVEFSEGSFEARREAVNAALATSYPARPDGCAPCVYEIELFDDRVVYEYEGKLYQAAYTYANGAATITAPAIQVVRTYAPVAGASLRKHTPCATVKLTAAEAARIRKLVNACPPKKSKQL
jgi:hypothetical protein